MSVRILVGDCRETLKTLPDKSVQMCCSSPPYFGLRDYGTASWEGGDSACDHVAPPRGGISPATSSKQLTSAGTLNYQYTGTCGKCGAIRVDNQLGLESTPAEYVEKMVGVFREVRRVLRDDGTLWLNIGDSYAGAKGQSGQGSAEYQAARTDVSLNKPYHQIAGQKRTRALDDRAMLRDAGIKGKDLIGIPWMLAFALRADGWYLRSDIIWHKPNPMPESVTDRPTKSHEYLFLLSKSERYFYDAEAIKEDAAPWNSKKGFSAIGQAARGGAVGHSNGKGFHPDTDQSGRNRRSVWTIATQPYSGAHFATFPPALIEPCIKAGSSDKSCEHCGKAWERQVDKKSIDRTTLPPDDPRYRPRQYTGAGGDDAPYAMGQRRGMYAETTTLGFAPACDCGSVNPVPSTVLDPFFGAGTTGLVADRLGRNAIGCELNPEYAKLARERIHSDNPLFVEVA